MKSWFLYSILSKKENPYDYYHAFICSSADMVLYAIYTYHFKYVFEILSLLSNAITVMLTYHVTIWNILDSY